MKEKAKKILHAVLGVEIIVSFLLIVVRSVGTKETGVVLEDAFIESIPSFLSVNMVLVIGFLLVVCAFAFRMAKVKQSLELFFFAGFVISCGVWFLVDFDYIQLFTHKKVVIECFDDLSIGFIPLFTTAYLSEIFKDGRTRFITIINYIVLLFGQFISIGFLFLNRDASETDGVFLFSLIFMAVSMLSGVCCLVYEAWSQKKRRLQMAAVLMAMVFIGIAVDTLDYYLQVAEHGYIFHILFLAALCVTVYWMVRYVIGSVQQAQRTAELENEVLQSQIAVMLSQIKPHFIFNTLNAISALCLTDPLKADETVITFSEYLRENINALETAEPVPFEQELHHVKNYAKIEQTRFGKKLTMKYDIEYTDFRIPTLTLQPIVENAIRHGIGKKETPGTVWIKVRRREEDVEISVEDDGVGFDMEGNYKREDSIGMKNVKTRLGCQVNAVMDVVSRPGEGTKVTVRIPAYRK